MNPFIEHGKGVTMQWPMIFHIFDDRYGQQKAKVPQTLERAANVGFVAPAATVGFHGLARAATVGYVGVVEGLKRALVLKPICNCLFVGHFFF